MNRSQRDSRRIFRLFAAASILAAVALLPQSYSQPSRDLTFEDRVAAQEAIERVLYAHQVGAAEPFETAVPRSLLERKVRTYLKQSAALEEVWRTPVTARALRAELTRMARDTKLPERLREIHAALGGDPVLAAECFARPVLVERLVRGFFARDERIHAAARREASALRDHLARGKLDPAAPDDRLGVQEIALGAGPGPDPVRALPEPGGASRVTLAPDAYARRRALAPAKPGEAGPVTEEDDAFAIRVLLEEDASHARVATYRVPKRSWDDWWAENEPRLDETKVRPVQDPVLLDPLREPGADPGCEEAFAAAAGAAASGVAASPPPIPQCDVWNNGALGNVEPEARINHTAVWTGNEMIVWGGFGLSGKLDSGGRYDPLTDMWRATTRVKAPSAREFHTAVWTGSRMVVWGGAQGGLIPNTNTGGRYDPSTDSWASTSTGLGAPIGRYGHSAVWTGREMVVWGGDSGSGRLNTGGVYDPALNLWTALPTTGAPAARAFHTAVWTGEAMVVWGGSAPAALNSGGKFERGAWTSTSTGTGLPSARFGHTAVMVGGVMVVWGGYNGTSYFGDGGRYDPAGNRWGTPPTTGKAPAARAFHTAVFTGTDMIIWGGQDPNSNRVNTGGIWDPNDFWTATQTTNPPAGRRSHTAVWTGSLMIVWGGEDTSSAKLDTGGRYNPAGDSWTPTSSTNPPEARFGHHAAWTGNLMLVWGGSNGSVDLASGGRYSPVADSWAPMALSGGPSRRSGSSAVWTGNLWIHWGGTSGGLPLATGARYNPIANTWSAVSTFNRPPGRWDHSAVWTGVEMIVWGGSGDSSDLDDGGRYDPVGNAWTGGTTLSSAPEARSRHTAVWTGTHMVVWGGMRLGSGPLDTGGLYDPSDDSWRPTAVVAETPSRRTRHTAVWTGDIMLIWGGDDGSGGEYDTGSGYYPVFDFWFPLEVAGAPSPRTRHTAVWADTGMLVWGGADCDGAGSCAPEPAGARLDPYTGGGGSWSPITIADAPGPRFSHSAVWTGARMMVWGGTGDGSSGFDDGGRYIPFDDTDSDGDGFSACTGDCDDGDALAYPGGFEFCDDVDNDCDGQVDGFPTSCGIGECAASGVCTAGVDSCAEGTPQTEACDDLDNDCDGTTDDFGTACGLGACEAFGFCSAGFDSCTPGQPSAEVCDNVDNNCDGAIDEGDPEGGQPCDTGLPGACAAGITECQGGFVACVQTVFPDQEVCDDLDNDCDGTADQFVTTCGEGACQTTGFCSGGVDSCVGRSPSSEVCDGIDNNCDGATDEGNPGGGAACFTGTPGACSTGTETCQDGAIVCLPNAAGTPEVCDNVDNNCDGATDEGNPGGGAPCVVPGASGVCAAGTETCQGGTFVCAQTVFPAAEICDNLDNNCDGTVDGFATSCGVGACARTGACIAGTNSCTPGAPSAEVCDNIDNNCDGATDGFATSCGTGACARSGLCAAGIDSCAPGAPSAELCDNVDNNCNGQTDEGNPGGGAACATGLPGACGTGARQCQSGSLTCVQTIFPGAEACDNVDNDCDGQTDGFATTCGVGACASAGTCTVGADSCVAIAPSAEVCDGADNDCDGGVDNISGQDPDGDGQDTSCDNCPAAYNPGQENSDGGALGDACELVVTFPRQGDLTCPSLPPTISWTPKGYTHFKVFVGWDPNFNLKFTSGKKLLTGTQWTPKSKKWDQACLAARPNIYIKVLGKLQGTTQKEFSQVTALTVK
jgi:N-acetylneuraminic acid mutarotase